LYFEELITHTNNFKAAANWMMGSVKSYLNQNALEIEDFPIAAEKIAQLIQLIEEDKINNSVATQKVFPFLVKNPERNPIEIAESNGWITKTDSSEIENVIINIFKNNPDEFERFKNGEKKLTGFFMGQVMREMKGAADPKTTTQLLNKLANEV
jgi:aspartyl-tRNA(Asn)/glutamyl-tRNA(Gln) amidotransferase subunit B